MTQEKGTGALRFKIAIVGGNRLFFLTHYWQNGEIEIGRYALVLAWLREGMGLMAAWWLSATRAVADAVKLLHA